MPFTKKKGDKCVKILVLIFNLNLFLTVAVAQTNFTAPQLSGTNEVARLQLIIKQQRDVIEAQRQLITNQTVRINKLLAERTRYYREQPVYRPPSTWWERNGFQIQ